MNAWLWFVVVFLAIALAGSVRQSVKLSGSHPAWRFVVTSLLQVLLIFCVLKGGGVL